MRSLAFEGVLLVMVLNPVVALRISRDPEMSQASLASRPYSISCRSLHRGTGSWSDCEHIQQQPSTEQTQMLFHREQTASRSEMVSQQCLDSVKEGKWMEADSALQMTSLGSSGRYAGSSFYLGPPSKVDEEPEQKRAMPHAKKYTRPSGEFFHKEKLPEFIWQPSSETSTCPKYDWIVKDKALDCLKQKWIAFWGDSTARIAFSALVDFLGDGIEVSKFPTHDFTYKKHWKNFDHCSEGSHCHLAINFPARNVVLTFNFVTTFATAPNMTEALGRYSDQQQFPNLKLHKDKPDIILFNEGPWEYYGLGSYPGWRGNDIYEADFKKFLMENWGNTNVQNPKLLVMRNTACSQHQGNCDYSTTSCVGAMDNVHEVQQKVVQNFVQETKSKQVRYVQGMYTHDYPTGYSCARETAYHLPSVITDQRINHALYAMCAE